jgi:flagellar M-ring protein FliF
MAQALASGQSDDIHGTMIAVSEASIQTRLMVNVKDKVLTPLLNLAHEHLIESIPLADSVGHPRASKEFWAGLSRAKRVAVASVTATVLLGVLAILALIGCHRSDYVYPVVLGLDTEDSAAHRCEAEELKVEHRRPRPRGPSSAGGEGCRSCGWSSPRAVCREAAAWASRSSTGARFGATEFEQQVNLRRAMEGELSRSINTIEGVVSARVHLVLPERRLFAARSEGASASVVVKLRPGQDFGRKEVAGIVHLVSSAVPGLTKERVSVVNTDGVTLHRPSSEQDSPAELEETHSQAAREIATNMENHVRSLLERVTGPGGVDVRINVDLDEASRERTGRALRADQDRAAQREQDRESTAQEGASVAGVPGAQTNLPDVDPSAPSGAMT